MNSREKRQLLNDIREYGFLKESGKQEKAREVFRKIEKEIETSREQFFRWMEET